MGIREDARGTWFFVGIGALIGVVLGILVSVTTDVPLAPEAGLILGALAGWLFRRVSTEPEDGKRPRRSARRSAQKPRLVKPESLAVSLKIADRDDLQILGLAAASSPGVRKNEERREQVLLIMQSGVDGGN